MPSLLGRKYWAVLVLVARLAPVAGNIVMPRRVGEKVGFPNRSPIGPAPAAIVAPNAGLFVFHTSVTRYVTPAVIGTTVWTKAAFGLKVPAYPPDSFQATAEPLTAIPRSWLYPAVNVHRSAFPLTRARVSEDGVKVVDNRSGSISTQETPSLLGSVYWFVLTFEQRPPSKVKRSTGLVADVPPGDVTVTSTVPIHWVGLSTVV